MIDIVILLRHIVLNNANRADWYPLIQGVLGCTRHTAKSLAFAWIYGASQEKLRSILKEEVTEYLNVQNTAHRP